MRFLIDLYVKFKQTRFGLVKLSMVFVAVGLLVVILFYTGMKSLIGDWLASQDKSLAVVDDIAVENSIFRSEFANGQVLVLSSSLITSKRDANKNNLVVLSDMKGQLLDTPEHVGQKLAAQVGNQALIPVIEFSTDLGIYQEKKNTLSLEDGVRINFIGQQFQASETINQLSIFGEGIQIQFANKTLSSQKKIYGTGNLGGRTQQEFLAQGILVEQQNEKISFLGQSIIVIDNPPTIEP